MTYNVLNHGAKGDGAANDAAAIQQAIDLCHKEGGGRVVLPGGKTYLSGSLVLKSNVELHLEHGAVLKAATDLNDYREVTGVYNENTPKGAFKKHNIEFDGEPQHFFIMAWQAENVAISGSGVIDGSEEIYYGEQTPYHISGSYYPRIPVLFLKDVERPSIRNITIRGSAFWTVHLVGCRDVLIDGIRILNNLKMANCDGIDPDHCQNVRISNCHLECADDCIVLKNSRVNQQYGNCENIVVTNCTLISTSAALKIGTESEGVFRNITMANCIVSKTSRGIALHLRDNGTIENVFFSNIHIDTRRFSPEWWGKAEPIYITALRRDGRVSGNRIKNIHFENISCAGENGIFLYTDQPQGIQNISFKNVRVKIEKTSRWPAGTWDLRPGEAPGEIPGKVHGVTCVGADDVRLENVSIEVDQSIAPWYGEDIFVENSRNVTV